MPAGDHDHQHRSRGIRLLAGVDEVGRGAFAGPMVAAAVILPEHDGIDGLDDSKKLTHQQRVDLAHRIRERAVCFNVISVEPVEIDLRGLHRSNLWALREALCGLSPQPEHAIVDGYVLAPMPFPHEAVPKADHLSRTVAAASILAKVSRDQVMLELDEIYPGYGFATNVGYGTSEHRAALDSLGPSPVHRRTFHGVGQLSLWSTG